MDPVLDKFDQLYQPLTVLCKSSCHLYTLQHQIGSFLATLACLLTVLDEFDQHCFALHCTQQQQKFSHKNLWSHDSNPGQQGPEARMQLRCPSPLKFLLCKELKKFFIFLHCFFATGQCWIGSINSINL